MSQYKVVIVGAGMSAACAARRLLEKQAVEPNDILIVEALDRIGGRTYKLTQECEREPNHPVDVGGAWICPEQKNVWALTEEQGLEIVAQQDRGMRVHLSTQGGLWDGIGRLLGTVDWKETERKCGLYSLPVADLVAYMAVGKKLDKLAKEVITDAKAPWTAKEAEKWDNLTVESWLVSEVSNVAARGILRGIVLAVFCLPTDQYSMLMFLAALKDENFQMFTVGAQSHRCKQGFGSLVPTLVSSFQEKGVNVKLNTKVLSCKQKSGDGVSLEIESSSGKQKLSADAVIVTVPPTMYETIKFSPELPQMPYVNDMNMGKCIKTVLAYKERWWHSTSGFADPSLGTPITLVFDVSHDDEPMLATFFYGDNAVEFSGSDKKEDRKKEAILGAQRLVGSDPNNPDPRSYEPLSVVEGDWPAMPNIFGGYAGVPKVGAITKHKHYRQTLGDHVGDIYFTGTETSEHWAGYIEGAMLSGFRTGDEVASKFLG